MKLMSTTNKSTPGFKHLEGQTNLSDFGFISYCPLAHQIKLDVYLEKAKQEGVEE